MDDAGSDEEMQISSESKAYYLNDPKKCLKSFFDREGRYQKHYKCIVHAV